MIKRDHPHFQLTKGRDAFKTNLAPSIQKRPPIHPSCNWADKAHDFSQNTSLHGLRYIGDTNLHFIERYFLFKFKSISPNSTYLFNYNLY